MKQKLLNLLKKHREVVSYLIFGVLTTAVSFAVYALFARVFMLDAVSSNVISWIVSVTFAYVTNRLYVFENKRSGISGVLIESASFYGSRLFSGGIETLIIYIFAMRLGWYDLGVKLVATVIVVVMNYVLSKVLVFKKQEARDTRSKRYKKQEARDTRSKRQEARGKRYKKQEARGKRQERQEMQEARGKRQEARDGGYSINN